MTEGWFVLNQQGDVIAIVDSSGNVAVQYRYNAWGSQTSQTLSGTSGSKLYQYNALKYRGYYYDAETGFYYVSSRYYDPEIGRFISADGEISGVGGDIRGYNLYAYCMNNPVNMSDPTGNWPRWISVAVAVVATVVAVVTAAPAAIVVAGVAACTYVAQTIHYDVRQSKNTNLPDSPQKATNSGWKNSKPKTPTNPTGGGPAADLHQYSSKDKSNVKYVSPDGKREVIFNKNNEIVLDPRDIGTYNFVPSGNLIENIGHGIFDVIPWALFGNSDDDWGPLINIFLE